MNAHISSHKYYDTRIVHALLRGEMAAVESYNQAIPTIANYCLRGELDRIRDDHQLSVCALRHWVRDFQETPDPNSGVWGYFAAAVTRLARLGGNRSTIAALKRGECHGEAAYRSSLGNPDLPDELRHLIGARLLPQCQSHVERLEKFEQFMCSAEPKVS
jgi:hypothetical protein